MQFLQMTMGSLELWQWIIMSVVLIPMSVKDIRKREINGYIGLLAIMATLIFRVTYLKEMDFVILMDIIPGAVFLLFSFLSKEKIGYGDGIMLVFVGCVMGFWKTILALMISLAVTAILAMIILMKQKGRNREIPFIPFMSMGILAGGLMI